jgi:hypothetical protein
MALAEKLYYTASKSKMISRWQGGGDAGVLKFVRRGADGAANEDSALI